MKRNKIIISIAIVAAIALAIFLLFFNKKKEEVQLETEKPQIGYISEAVTATGTVQPVDTTTVGSRISATIEEVYVDFNSTVKKGQLLAVLDKSLLQATVDQVKANLAEAQSNAIYQKSNFNRQDQLFKTGSVSRAEYEIALNTYNASKASVNSIKAQLYSAERNVSFTRIYSPVDGVVLSRSVSPGQTVAASFNTPTLFSIATDITKMQVEAAVDEADIGNISNGQRTTFTVDAYLNDVFKGTVKSIRLRPTTTSNVVTYTTILDAPNDALKLKPGMTASITIYTKEVNKAMLIPAKALKYNPDSTLSKKYTIEQGGENSVKSKDATYAYIWVLNGNIISRKQIRTGLNNNTQVEVLEGLAANDQVITGTSTAAAGTGTAAASSPFLPQRPKR